MKFFSRGLLARILSVLLVCSMVSFGSVANARYISPDSWDPTTPGVGTNRYAYANNDPINKSDPNGHQAEAIIGGGLTALLGACAASGPCGVAVAVGMVAVIGTYSAYSYFSGPASATKDEMAGKNGIYTGAGSWGDWGNKGAHWKGVDDKGRPVEVGIRPGKNGEFGFEPVIGDKAGKEFDQAVGSLGPTLGSQKGLEKLQGQIKGALDNLPDSKYADKKRELRELLGQVDDKISDKEKSSSDDQKGGNKDSNNDNQKQNPK